jgi:hypothetical protein
MLGARQQRAPPVSAPTNAERKLAAQKASLWGAASKVASPTPPAADFSLDTLKQKVETNQTRVRDLFRSWDKDNSGTIDRNEFRKGMFALGFGASKEQIEQLFDQLDADSSGELDYNELRLAIRNKPARTKEPSPTRSAHTGLSTSVEVVPSPISMLGALTTTSSEGIDGSPDGGRHRHRKRRSDQGSAGPVAQFL